MNQPRQIFKNTTILAVATLIERASTTVLALFISRILQATGLGIYSAVLVYYDLLSRAAEGGAANLITREIGRNPAKTNRYVVLFGVIAVAFSAICMALFILVLPYLALLPELKEGIYIVILALPPGTISSMQQCVFIAHQRTEFITLTSFLTALLNVGVSIYLLMNGYGVLSLLIVFVMIQYVTIISHYYFIHRYVSPLHWEFRLAAALSLVREMKTFAVLSIFSGLFSRPEVIILSLVASAAQVGFYSAALKVVSLWQYIPGIFLTNVFPVLARSYYQADQKAQYIQNKSMKYLLAICLPLTVGTFVAAESIVSLLYGPGFEPTVIALRLLALNIPLAALWAVLWRVLVARDQQSVVVRAMMIVTVTELALGYLLIAWLGTLGAAITTPIISLLYALILAFYVKQDGTGLRLVHLSWRFGLAALGMGALIWLFGRELELWILVPAGAICYTLLVIVLKAFSADDFMLFRRIWRPRATERSL
jgi:O-antigen/teichoic acid export membrane protein